MPIKILMPSLSPTMEHGSIAKWIKKEGDQVLAGEVIAEIETDKATMEVEAVDEGIIAKIIVPEGAQEVAVNSLIAVLIEEGEELSSVDDFTTNNKPLVKEKDILDSKVHDKQPILSDESGSGRLEIKGDNFLDDQVMQSEHLSNNKVFSSPLARRIADKEGINLSTILGSGPRGRIVKDDIVQFLDNKNSSSEKRKVQRNPKEYSVIPNTNLRKVIAKRLLDSKQTIPHFYLFTECNMDSVMEVRAKLNTSFGNEKSKKLSVNDFIILASAKALKEIPDANASWTDDAIRLYNNIDISIAVAIEGGLITPIIRNADQKDIIQISSEMKSLAKKAKENNLKPEEFQGGGFSISNLGMYGVKSFNAIVNPPQGCILAAGASSRRVVAIDNKIEIKTMMDVSISCDHRVIDGSIGALFLNAFKKYIQSPVLMFI